MTLDLKNAPGRFDLRWIDINTGEWGSRDVVPGGSAVTLSAPTRGHWLAALTRDDLR